MSYIEIDLDKIDDNPFQTRVEYDDETLAGIMSTASNGLGIRYAPIVRPHPEKADRYQIASGHGRIIALRALGKKTATVKVVDLNDRQMKTEILVENVNRSNLSERERFAALEAIRIDPNTDDPNIRKMLLNKEKGWIAELSRRTGVHENTLLDIYDVKEMREVLEKVDTKAAKDSSSRIIRATTGLEKEDRSKLIVQANRRGWNRPTVQKIKDAVQQMEPEIRKTVLEDEQSLTPSVIEKLSEIDDSKKQQTLIQQIKTQRLDEGMALQRIQRVKEQEPLSVTTVQNEYAEVMEDFRKTMQKIKTWGINQYMILGDGGWSEAMKFFDEIENHMRWLKRTEFLKK